MKHFVLLKFKPNYFSEDILNYTKEVFCNIEKLLDDISDVNVYSNCVNRDTNMDIMVEMKLENKEMLNTYLKHELHQSFVNVVNEHLISRVTFDCED